MNRPFLFQPTLALLLTVGLALPGPALALRPTARQEAGLEELEKALGAELEESAIEGMLRRFTGHTGWVEALAFSPDGQTLASAGHDRAVRLWGPSFATLKGRLEEPGATVPEKLSAIRLLGLLGGKEALSELFIRLEGGDPELLPALLAAVPLALTHPDRAVAPESRQWEVLLERLSSALERGLSPEQADRIFQGLSAAVRLKGPPLERGAIRGAAQRVLVSLGISFSETEEKAFARIAPKSQIAQALWAWALRSRLSAASAKLLARASVRNRLDMAHLLVLMELLRLEPSLAGFLDQAASIAKGLAQTPRNQYLAALLKGWLPKAASVRPALYALGMERLLAGQLQAPLKSAPALTASAQALEKAVADEAGRILNVQFDPGRPSPLTAPEIPELKRRMFLQAVLYQAEHRQETLARALGAYLVALQQGLDESQALAAVHQALAEEAPSLPAPLPQPPASIERIVQPLAPVQARAEERTGVLWQEIRTHLSNLAGEGRMPAGELRKGLANFVTQARGSTPGPDQAGKLQSEFLALSQQILEDPEAGRVEEIRALVETIRGHLNDLVSQRVAQERETQPVAVRIEFAQDPVRILHLGWPDLRGSCLDCVNGPYRHHAQEYATHPGVVILFAYDANAPPQTAPPFARLAALRTREGSLLVTSRLRSDRALDLTPVFAEALELYAREIGQPVLLPASFFPVSPGSGWKQVTVEVTLPEGAQPGFYSDLTGSVTLPHTLRELAVWQHTPPPAAGLEEERVNQFRKTLSPQQEKIIAQLLRGKEGSASIIAAPQRLVFISKEEGGGALTDEELKRFLGMEPKAIEQRRTEVLDQIPWDEDDPGKRQRYEWAWDDLMKRAFPQRAVPPRAVSPDWWRLTSRQPISIPVEAWDRLGKDGLRFFLAKSVLLWLQQTEGGQFELKEFQADSEGVMRQVSAEGRKLEKGTPIVVGRNPDLSGFPEGSQSYRVERQGWLSEEKYGRLSRTHLSILWTEGEKGEVVVLEDLGSTNGVFLPSRQAQILGLLPAVPPAEQGAGLEEQNSEFLLNEIQELREIVRQAHQALEEVREEAKAVEKRARRIISRLEKTQGDPRFDLEWKSTFMLLPPLQEKVRKIRETFKGSSGRFDRVERAFLEMPPGEPKREVAMASDELWEDLKEFQDLRVRVGALLGNISDLEWWSPAAGLEELGAETTRRLAVELWSGVWVTPASRKVDKLLMPAFHDRNTFSAIPLVARGELPFLILALSEIEAEAVRTLLTGLSVDPDQYRIWRLDEMALSVSEALVQAQGTFSGYDLYPVDPGSNWLKDLQKKLQEAGAIPLDDFQPAFQATQDYFQFV